MKYFISYVYYEGGQSYFGNAEWEGSPINSVDEVESIEEEVADQFEDKVYVKLLFWRPFETE